MVNKKVEDDIIKLYSTGLGSVKISRLLNITKQKVLKVLNKYNLIIKKINPLYDTFKYDGEKWVTTYVCESCDNIIEFSANKKYYLARNLKNKKICKVCSTLGENNPFYNKKHSDETKNKISNSRVGKCLGENNAMNLIENRLKVSKGLKNKWDSGELENLRIKLSNSMIEKHKNGVIKNNNRSKAEDELIKILNDNNIISIPTYLVGSKVFDIYIPKYNLLIEYNGDYWHCNPKKYDENYLNVKKNKTAKEIWEYDKNKINLAINLGYNCEIIWEHDYKKDKKIINKIINKYETNN